MKPRYRIPYHLRSARGSTLVQVMISAVLAAFIALAVNGMIVQANNEASMTRSKNDFVALASDVRMVLSKSQNCKMAFQSLKLESQLLANPANVMQLGKPNPLVIPQIGPLRPGSTLKTYNLYLSELTLTNARSAGLAGNGTPLYMADLVIAGGTALRTPASEGAAATPQRHFKPLTISKLYLNTDAASKITNCYTYDNLDTLKGLCTQMGGEWDDVKNVCTGSMKKPCPNPFNRPLPPESNTRMLKRHTTMECVSVQPAPDNATQPSMVSLGSGQTTYECAVGSVRIFASTTEREGGTISASGYCIPAAAAGEIPTGSKCSITTTESKQVFDHTETGSNGQGTGSGTPYNVYRTETTKTGMGGVCIGGIWAGASGF